MTGAWLRKLITGGLAGIVLAVSMPVAAQNFSDGYKFLKAVKDRDLTEANKFLDEPGSTVINSRDLTSGESGLHIAVQRRDLYWVQLLTGRGANANIRDKRGITPLSLSVQLGWVDGVRALVGAGARVDEANDAGETPLIAAVHRRDAGLIRVLLAAGASPERSDNSGRTARDYAEQQGNTGPVMAEFRRHDASRSGAGGNETYGPR